MKIISFGAAQEVTGSQHLLEVNGKRILLDCGMFQGKRMEAFAKNHDLGHHLGFDPSKVDAMVLSHAHIDHCGNIPTLVKGGFRGPVYCTEATKDLAEIMMLDSAHIQESDAEYFSRKHKDTAQPMEPLYKTEDAQFALKSFTGKPYDKAFELFPGIKVTFREAGHVLGSAQIVMEINDKEDKKKKVFVFSGDIGRYRLPIIRDPYVIENANVLMVESTYGNRTHDPIEEGGPGLARVINRTIRRGGKILIPAFAFERTQELIYIIHTLIKEKKIPDNLPIFMDSPMASNINNVFRKYADLYDDEIKAQFKKNINPFALKQLKETKSSEESKKLNFIIGPAIIIASSGMCEAGRIRHHLANNLEDPKNTVVIVGYMAEHTLGRKLVDGEPVVKLYDRMVKVNAEIVILEAFSAHADMNDLDTYVGAVKGLKKVLIVHGEPDQSGPFADRIRLMHKKAEVDVMEPGKTIEA
jgi:metallo-beta-lactamase family protein